MTNPRTADTGPQDAFDQDIEATAGVLEEVAAETLADKDVQDALADETRDDAW